MDRRVFGLESELAIVYEPAPGEPHRPEGLTIFAALSASVLSKVKALTAKHRKAGHFLENGAFLHYEGRPDLHSQGLLEYSTPECRTARELALYAKAGERLLQDAIPDAERTLAAAGHCGHVILGKNARDPQGNTYGSHENYLVEDPLSPARALGARLLLVLFFITTLPFLALALGTLLLSVFVYYLIYFTILGIGLLSILLVQLSPPLHHRAGSVSMRLDRALERFDQGIRDPLWRGYGLFFHYLFLPPARLLSGILRTFVFRDIRRQLPTFLATRQIFTGSGHLSWDPDDPIFGVSEKGPTITHVARLYWDDARPMIDLKNFVFEGSSAVGSEKRLHVMMSDSNMSEFADYLKFGTTSLVLRAIRQRAVPASLQLIDPIASLHRVAWDPSLSATLPLVDGRELTALQIQRELLECCERHVRSQDTVPLADLEVLKEWRRLLDDLGRDPASTADRVDWVLKRQLIDDALEGEELDALAPWRLVLRAAERAGVELQGDGRDLDRLRALLPTPWFQRLTGTLTFHRLDPDDLGEAADLLYRAKKVDLKYHDITDADGYYRRCRAAGLTRRLFDEREIEEAIRTPPPGTRASARGAFVKRHHRDPKGRVNWRLGKAGRIRERFPDPLSGPRR